MEFFHPDGATPLDHEAQKGLIPALTTQRELNAFEQANILGAIEWAESSRVLKADLFSVHAIRLIHKRMFDQTWRWAGEFRLTQLNIGIEWVHIPEQVKALCDDAVYWEQRQIFDLSEIALRFHHRLVQIHPFPNGNGRLSRLCADLVLKFRGAAALRWGKRPDLNNDSPDRREYIASLRDADGGNYSRLIRFASK